MPKPIKCRKCGQRIELNPDSIEAREAGTDPYQQMRSHIENCFTFNELVEHTKDCGWLVNMLFFHPEPEHVEWWLRQITALSKELLNLPKEGQ